MNDDIKNLASEALKNADEELKKEIEDELQFLRFQGTDNISEINPAENFTLDSIEEGVPSLNFEIPSSISGSALDRSKLLKQRENTQDLNYESEVIAQLSIPVYKIKNGKVDFNSPKRIPKLWNKRIKKIQSIIEPTFNSVGRIEARLDGNDYVGLGTGWVTENNLVVTNRHVAEYFTQYGSEGLRFKKIFFSDESMQVKMDFTEEPFTLESDYETPIIDVLYISKTKRPDIAILKIHHDNSNSPFESLLLAGPNEEPSYVGVIGYPEDDDRADRLEIQKVFGDIYGEKRFSPGRINELSNSIIRHSCNTLGGNSGSPLINLETGKVVGLHFGGKINKENYAEPVSIISKIIRNLPRNTQFTKKSYESTNLLQKGNLMKKQKIIIPIEIEISIGEIISDVKNSNDSNKAYVSNLSNEIYDSNTEISDDELLEAVGHARLTFSGRDDVVSIRPGWKFINGKITDQKAIVVCVKNKQSPNDLSSVGRTLLPKVFDNIPIDVTVASILDLLHNDDELYFSEYRMRTGNYKKRPNLPLNEINKRVKLTIQPGPDSGPEMLQNFLRKTTKHITIGMYEFTAPHIYKTFSEVVKDNVTVDMVLQKTESIGSGTKKYDYKDEETVQMINDLIEERLNHQWASVGSYSSIFPYSYHIKVAVRDKKAIWLSSGSWQSSNQPPESPNTNSRVNFLNTYNREWHVIIENTDVSTLFHDHIVQDLEDVESVLESNFSNEPMFLLPEIGREKALEESSRSPKYFEPLKLYRKIKFQPILTPDNYVEHVLPLIESAKESIWFQNQSFSIANNISNDFRVLLDALKKKQEEGIDIKIIIRGEWARSQLEGMKFYGFKTNNIRLQNKCHNKAIIVDQNKVLMGSHNWTSAGTTNNRDASILFYDEEIAQYLSSIFEYDWNRIGSRVTESLEAPIMVESNYVASEGMMIVSLSELGF